MTLARTFARGPYDLRAGERRADRITSQRVAERQSRARDQITLQIVAAEIHEHARFGLGLDTLADDLRPLLAAQLGHRTHEPLLHRVLIDIADERHVELDVVTVERRERAHSCVAAAEIIDRDLEAELAQLGDAIANVGLTLE